MPTQKKLSFMMEIYCYPINNLNLNYAEKLLIEKLKIKYSLEEKAYLQLTTFQDSLLGESIIKLNQLRKGLS